MQIQITFAVLNLWVINNYNHNSNNTIYLIYLNKYYWDLIDCNVLDIVSLIS